MSTSLVTGAGRGIGLEFCRQLAERGGEIVAVCRRPSAELAELDVRIESGIDVTSDAGVEDLRRRLQSTRIDLLINNAGILERQSLSNMDLAGIRRQFEVNALGPLRITTTLLDNMQSGAKVAMVTSLMGSMTDNTSGGHYGYRMSKAALNMASVSLARDLAERGIAVGILHPGYVRTDMTGQQGNLTAEESVRGMLRRIDALDLASSGQFWHANGNPLPW